MRLGGDQREGTVLATVGSEVNAFADVFRDLEVELGKMIRGKAEEIGMVLLAMLAGGHVLLEDNPGTGKTTLARAIAKAIGGKSNRVQFTPDLLPADVTGGMVFRQNEGTFTFHHGPIFAHVVLVDEINRASPKTQSALLEAMAEGQVSVDSTTTLLPDPFIVLATQNPIEQEGVYRLPEAQLDRFMVKLTLGYPDHDAEVLMLEGAERDQRPEEIRKVVEVDEFKGMQVGLKGVRVDPVMRSYMVRLCAFTRDPSNMPDVRLGASPRGAIALMRIGRALAASQGSSFVTDAHVQRVAPYVLGHRLVLTPQAEAKGVNATELVREVLRSVPTPTA